MGSSRRIDLWSLATVSLSAFTVSHAGLVGGGRWPRPGEVLRAHRGVLFLDGYPRFSHYRSPRRCVNPLEDGVVTISRAHGSVNFQQSSCWSVR